MADAKHTTGEWNFAADSYGKVRHSKKACVYSNVTTPKGDMLVTIAARIDNWHDARVMAAAKLMLSALVGMNHVTDGGYCICPCKDGHATARHHSTNCADSRAAIAKAGGQ